MRINNPRKAVYALYGVKMADEATEKPSRLRKAIVPAVGALGGLAAYKYFRSPKLSPSNLLKPIQQQAQKGFHRIVDVSQNKLPTGASLKERAMHAIQPRVNDQGKLDLWNRFKLGAAEGGEAIPTAFHKNKTITPLHPKGADVDGYVFGRRNGPLSGEPAAKYVRGGKDIEGSMVTQRALSNLSRAGKDVEADLLQKHAPGAMPETNTNLSDVLPRRRYKAPADKVNATRQLQADVAHKMGPDEHMLKLTRGLASSGQFPKSDQDWGSLLENYQKHISVPENAKALRSAERTGENDLAAYLKQHGIFEGHTLNEGLKFPGDLISQKKIQNPLGEYRVHTINGTAPKNLIYARHPQNFVQRLKGIPKELPDFVQDQLGKLPDKYRKGNYGMDVMPFKKPDGSTGFKIIELNPHEVGTRYDSGAASGFLSHDTMPFVGHQHYKAVTGRDTDAMATAKALGIGCALAGGASLATKKDE